MAALNTRANKGAQLGYEEVDANWEELETRTGQGWNDLVHDVTIRTAGNPPTLSLFRDGLYTYAFSPTEMNECFANFHLRHDYIAGTMVFPHVHWAVNTTSTGTVRWGVEYTLARRNDSTGLRQFGATSTLYIEVNISSSRQYWHMVSESAPGAGIPGTDLEEDSLILCRFFRDASHVNDTFPDDVFLLTVDIHYECHTLCTPSRFPPFV